MKIKNQHYFVCIDGKYVNVNYQIIDLIGEDQIEVSEPWELFGALESIANAMNASDFCIDSKNAINLS